ncbi:MAG TPA: carbonic anhydrase family protein [Thermoanaerobaculia bacterium]|nr:carbonic anhydrase family protein [Thermoanaerobaculia bacterium]
MQISRFRRFAVLCLGLVAAACAPPGPAPQPRPVNCCEVPWGYEAPENWASLSPCYSECGTGGEQSPIDIFNPKQQTLPAVDFSSYGKVPGLTSINDGHTIKIEIPAGAASLRLDGMAYELKQFHFHTPSEHKIRGNERPIEMHFVNVSSGGRVVAIGVFIKNGTTNPELAKIWQDLPKKKGDVGKIGEINLARLLPSGRTSFRYAGSLTIPPCGQGYQWIVYHDAIELATTDIEELQKIFPGGNRREVKPLNGRVVVTDVARP